MCVYILPLATKVCMANLYLEKTLSGLHTGSQQFHRCENDQASNVQNFLLV